MEHPNDDRIARMMQAAQDGKTQQRCAQAEDGRRVDVPQDDYPPTRDGHFGRDGTPPRHGRHHHRRMGRFARKLIGIAVLLVILIVAVLIFWPRVQEAMSPNFSVTLPDSLSGLLPDETMGYKSIDFSNAILGESREQKELVVMEQDVEVTSQISQDLLNIALFSKHKIIRSFGTGVYTVNLNDLSAKDINLDETTHIITVSIPHTKLSYVSVDVEKTQFEDTRKAIFAVGEIKLTSEQQHLLDTSIVEALNERLNEPALFTKADEIALNKAREIFQAPVTALSPEYVVKVIMK